MIDSPPRMPLLRPATGEAVTRFWQAVFEDPHPSDARSLGPEETLQVATAALQAAAEPPSRGLTGFEVILEGQGQRDDLAALLRHIRLMIRNPRQCGRESAQTVLSAGETPPRLVEASQVATFAVFLSRLVHAHDILDSVMQGGDGVGEQLKGEGPLTTDAANARQHPRDEYPLMDWSAWIPVAERDRTSPADDAKGASDYYRVLNHAPTLLQRRTHLYDEIMTGTGALMRADRELVALATSLETGCSFCASVHARRHYALTRDTVITPTLKHEGPSALPTQRLRALAELGAAMATTPCSLTTRQISSLVAAGVESDEIMDAAAVAAMFTWANRLMMTLGFGAAVRRRPRSHSA